MIFMFMAGTVLQPFLPGIIQQLLISLRLVILPVIMSLFLFNTFEKSFFIFIVLFAFTSQLISDNLLKVNTTVYTLSMLSCFPFFKAGIISVKNDVSTRFWWGLLYGAMVPNIITIYLFANFLSGGNLAEAALSVVNRDGEDVMFRFALGNAIEVPALLCALTSTAVYMLNSKSKKISIAVVINLLMATISQSRVIVVLGLITFIRHFFHGKASNRILMILPIVVVLILYNELFVDTIKSIISRLGGDDYGSADFRKLAFTVVFKQPVLGLFTIGFGLGSAPSIMLKEGIGYNSVESVMLQFIVEIGLFGILIFFVFNLFIFLQSRIKFSFNLEMIFIAIQTFFFLPMYSATPIFLFMIGILIARPKKIILSPVFN